MEGNLTVRSDPWFEEGFAEYFSSIEVDNKEARVGKIPTETYQILQQTGLMKVSDLFRVQQNTKTYNETGERRTTFYAESGLVVHYLYDNLLIPKLAAYFEALQVQKKSVEEAVQASFGMTAEKFDMTLRNYLREGRYRYYPVPTPAGIVASEFTVTPVSLSDARATLADIHGHSPDYRDKSLAEFQEVLKIDPDNASALRGLGFAYMQQKDFEHAAEYLHRAAQRDSKDPRVHYYYALLLSREGPPDSARAAEIKKELEASLALDPTLADAYSLLGYTQAFSGEPEKGLISLKKAIQLSPRNERYLFNLANVCMMNNRIDDAILIFRSLATSRDPQVAMQSDQALAQAITFKEQTKQVRVQLANHSTDTTPTQKLQESAGVDSAQDAALPAKVPTTAIHFLKGKIVALDCSAPPQAMMTVASGPKSITLHIRDSAHVVLLGADAFSCDWKGQSVAVNYRDRSDGDGDVVSLEMQ